MKSVPAVILLLIAGCAAPGKKEPVSMQGAYKMRSVGVKTDKSDTTYTNSTQMKIYTEGFMMYASVNAPDSVGGFGVAAYSTDQDSVTENSLFTAYDSSSSDRPQTFRLGIEKKANGYKQVIAGMQGRGGGTFDLTEVYENAGTAVTTPLDGAWKMTKRYYFKGKDTTLTTAIQYKTYFAGNCIWGSFWKDSLQKGHTAMGFGKFAMNGDHKIKESMTASTFSAVRGHEFDIDLDMMGKDAYRQTMDVGGGYKSVEEYERLKK